MLAVTGAALASLALAAPGQAATCGFAGSTVTVTFAANDFVTMAVSGTAITMNGAPCGAATTSTADLIATATAGTGGNETFAVDLGGGPFAPGATAEPSGVSEIEFGSTSEARPTP